MGGPVNGRGAALTALGPAEEVFSPMEIDPTQSRPRGTGSLLRRRQSSGGESWYGKWRADGRQVMRVLGPVRQPGSRSGLTAKQAEAALGAAIAAPKAAAPEQNGLDIA